MSVAKKDEVKKIESCVLNYDNFRNILNNFYIRKEMGKITYYLNALNLVIAREEDNVLNLYFNHVDNLNTSIPISMVIIKDFILKGMFKHKKSDVIITRGLEYDAFTTDGLNKGYNVFSQADRMKITTIYDDHITINPDEIIKLTNSMDYYNKEEIDVILSNLYRIKEQLKMAKKLQIGSISTINHNVNPNDKHLSLYRIPGYSLELHDYATFYDQPCGLFGQSFYVLNEKIKPSSNATITENHLKHHNYAKLYKPTIKKA